MFMKTIAQLDQLLPLRLSLRCLLIGCGIISVIVALTVYQSRSHFPLWFSPIALVGMACFIVMITFYIWTVHRFKAAMPPPGAADAAWLWGLLISSVICTSSLHGFAPFHPHILTEWSQIPSDLRFITYNFVLTGSSLAVVIALAILYFHGRQHLALTGLVILAGVMLIPNDDCPNDFNRPWISCLGASPLMFLGSAVVLLIGYCGLNGIRPRISALLMGLINTGVLLLGFGHQTGLVW
jgi:hypothetical protein